MVDVQAAEADAENVEETSAKKIKLAPAGDSELDEKIAKQVEYYFSDVNVIKDKFMREKFGEDDGWVKLSVLLTFARLKDLAKDETRTNEALKGRNSDVIEYDEKEKRVRRKNPLPDPEQYQKQLDERTVHISGFPTDYTFETLLRFCGQFGEVESLSMRRLFKSRFFKGCIHVVYKQKSDALKVIETDPLKCKDRELRTETMEAYHKRKTEMAEKRKAKSAKSTTKAAKEEVPAS